MSDVVIRIGGADITEHVIYSDAEFTSAARGRAGTARFRIKDLEHQYEFSTGDTLTLDVDGIRKWGGFVGKIERGYFFEADCTCKVPITPRYLLIDGMDYNVLLQKRVLYDQGDPTNMELTRFPTGTADQTVLLYYLANHTDLLADGITTGLIESVDTPFVDDPVSGGGGWTVDQFCRYLTSETGAIYYIDPDKNFVLTDVDTPNAPFGISDDPVDGEVGCRELEIDFDGSDLRNDAMAWGAGQGSQSPVFSRVEDAASIAEHGRWQVGKFTSSVWQQATVERIADSYVYGSPQNRRGGKDDRTSIMCIVFEPDFRVAQKVSFRSTVFDFTDVIPIRSETITFNSPTDPQYKLILAHDIDDPWTTFEFWFPSIPDWDPPLPPDFPEPQLPPNNPCASAGGGNCIDTFTRFVPAGIGESEFGGFSYAITGGVLGNRISVDGSDLVFSGSGGGGSILYAYSPALPLTYPVTVEFEMRWVDGATIFGTNPFVGLNLFSSPAQAAQTLSGKGYLNFRMSGGYSDGSFGLIERRDVSASGNFSTLPFSLPFSGGYTYHVKVQVDDGGRTYRWKRWPMYGPEPDWQFDNTITSTWVEFGISSIGFQVWGASGFEERCWIDNLHITQGLSCIGNDETVAPYVEEGTPYLTDTFSRVVPPGDFGTIPGGLTWTIDDSHELGAYVDGDKGHMMSVVDDALLSGPRLALPVAPGSISAWLARIRFTCIARGSRNLLYFSLGHANPDPYYLTAGVDDYVSFTLDPFFGIDDQMNITKGNATGADAGNGTSFQFVDGHDYELVAILSAAIHTATITDLATEESTTVSASGTGALRPRFEMGLYLSSSPGDDEVASHFAIDQIELLALSDEGLDQGLGNPCTTTDEDCDIETFNRPDQSGWGTSEINGVAWTGGGEIVSDRGMMETSIGFSIYRTFLNLSRTYPVDITWDLVWDALPTYNVPSLLVTHAAIMFHAADIANGPGVWIRLASDGHIALTIFTTGAASINFVTNIVSYTPNSILKCRARFEDGKIYGKVWAAAQSEPIEWTGQADAVLSTAPARLMAYAQFSTGGAFTGPDTFFDNIRICEQTTSPSNSPDDEPCAGIYQCETMAPLVLGQSYQSTYQWRPGTDEVWVDGIRIDYRDYTAQPDLRVILLDQALSNTAASVRICYIAVCNGD